MVKYYYDKYTSIENVKWVEQPYWLGDTEVNMDFNGKIKSYSFDAVNNKFMPGSTKWAINEQVSTGSLAYLIDGNELYKFESKQNSNSISAGPCLRSYKRTSSSTQDITYSRGSLVQSNIQAENGTYPTDGRHTDGYWYVRKGVVNQNPIITPVGTVPSGAMSVKPTFNYKVTDPDGNTMTVTESIDGIVFNTRTGVASGTQLTFTPTDLAWLRTRIKQAVNITITAEDGKGGVTTAKYPITRTTPAIDMQLKTPFSTDVAARRLLLKLEGNIPADAVVSVQACNNAFDTSPTWENATNLVLTGFPYPFTNKTKTAAKWGVSFKVRVERGNSVLPIYIDGLGGAYD